MSYKAFTLAAILAVSQAVSIEATQKYLEEGFKMPWELLDAITYISILDEDNDALLSKKEFRDAVVYFGWAAGDVDGMVDFYWQYLDKNADGLVSAVELASVFGIPLQYTPELIVRKFDRDGDG